MTSSDGSEAHPTSPRKVRDGLRDRSSFWAMLWLGTTGAASHGTKSSTLDPSPIAWTPGLFASAQAHNRRSGRVITKWHVTRELRVRGVTVGWIRRKQSSSPARTPLPHSLWLDGYPSLPVE